MKILKYDYNETVIKEIENELAAMQQEVEGYIEPVAIPGTNIIIMCNEEGAIRQLKPVARVHVNSSFYLLICGPFFVCTIPHDDSEDFADVTDEALRWAEWNIERG